MATHQHDGAAAPGQVAPRSDEAPSRDESAQGFKGQGTTSGGDLRSTPDADQALLAIEGESYADAYIERLHMGMAQPAELSVYVSFLADDMLRGFCRVLAKALGRTP